MAARTVARERLLSGQVAEELRVRFRALGYTKAGRRDLRLDFLRGLAAAAMVLDHIGGDTVLTRLTGGNQFIVSAAEGFVFLSGLVVGMVYGERIVRVGPGEALRGLLHRALTLYKASAGIALAFLALFFLTDVRLWMNRDAGLLLSDPWEAVAGVLSLHFSFHGSDVLVMYTLMMAASPALVYLLYRGRAIPLLLGSVALWAVLQRYPQEAVFPWAILGSSFPVAAWQLIFVLGMVVGYHRDRVSRLLVESGGFSRLLVLGGAGASFLLAWSYERYGSVALPESWFGGAAYGSLFAKVELGPGRVLAFLGIMVVAYALVHTLWVPLSDGLGRFLLPLGQSSLYVYIMHLFVIVLIYNLVSELMPVVYSFVLVPPDVFNLASQVFGLGLVWVMVRTRFLFALVPR